MDARVAGSATLPSRLLAGSSGDQYRRFFQINELAGIRIEVPTVFEATHRLVLELIRQRRIHGLRIDHIDGLFDPKQYLERLQRRAREVLAPPGQAPDPNAERPLEQPSESAPEK